MSNIFNIQQELLNIFAEVEENDGELTPELEEQLSITRESFKNKIKDYTDVIKMLQSDIADIKAEKDRLNSFQKSKEKTVERLKKIIIDAVEQFGDTTKAGGKFVDYGTGKVSIKKSDVIDINESLVNRFVNRYLTALRWYEDNNQLQRSIVDDKELLSFANSKTSDEDDMDIPEFSLEDLANLKAKINTEIDLNTLLTSDKGFDLAKALIRFGCFDVEAKPDKNAIKKIAKEEHTVPVYANIGQSKSVIIK